MMTKRLKPALKVLGVALALSHSVHSNKGNNLAHFQFVPGDAKAGGRTGAGTPATVDSVDVHKN